MQQGEQERQQQQPQIPVDDSKNNALPKGNRKNNGDPMLTNMETYNMKLNRKEPSPFMPMPRVSTARGFPDGDGGPWNSPPKISYHDGGDGYDEPDARRPPDDDDWDDGGGGRKPGGPGRGGGDEDQPDEPGGKRGPRHHRKRKRPDGEGEETEEEDEDEPADARPKGGDVGGGPEAGGKTKFRRNVPPYYKTFELNSRFFLSGLGMITLCNIIVATIAVITCEKSDPAIHYRQVVPHMHLTMLAIILIVLILKYSFYIFHLRNLNRRMEIAHILFFIVIVITTGFYSNWLLNTLPKDIHNSYHLRLPCAGVGNADTAQPAPLNQEKNLLVDEKTKETPLKVWYACSLIRSTYRSGIACVVFSCLLLLGLVANIIHAFMGIQNDIDLTS